MFVDDIKIMANEVEASAKKEIKFYEPKLHVPEWDVEKADISYGYIVTKTFQKEPPQGVDIKYVIPTVFLDINVMEEVKYVFNKLAETSEEGAIYFLAKKLNSMDPHYLVHSWFMPLQDVSSSEVEMDMDDSMRYFTYLKEKYPTEYDDPQVQRYIIQTHSHHNMGLTNWSGTDIKHQTSRSQMGFMADYKIFGLYTVKEGFKFTFVNYKPVYFRVEDCNVGLYFNKTVEWGGPTKDRKKELDEMMKELVIKKRQMSSYNHILTYDNDLIKRDYGVFWDNSNIKLDTTATKANDKINYPNGKNKSIFSTWEDYISTPIYTNSTKNNTCNTDKDKDKVVNQVKVKDKTDKEREENFLKYKTFLITDPFYIMNYFKNLQSVQKDTVSNSLLFNNLYEEICTEMTGFYYTEEDDDDDFEIDVYDSIVTKDSEPKYDDANELTEEDDKLINRLCEFITMITISDPEKFKSTKVSDGKVTAEQKALVMLFIKAAMLEDTLVLNDEKGEDSLQDFILWMTLGVGNYSMVEFKNELLPHVIACMMS